MLDCDTERGQHYMKNEDEVALKICEAMKCEQRKFGGKDTHLDRIFFRKEDCVAVAEIKSREMSIEELKGYGSYLISYDKINTGRALSGLIGVPYLLYVKLIKDNTIVYWKVTDNNGNYIVNFNTKKTETKSNCNGGKALRENSYIQLDEMKVLSV